MWLPGLILLLEIRVYIAHLERKMSFYLLTLERVLKSAGLGSFTILFSVYLCLFSVWCVIVAYFCRFPSEWLPEAQILNASVGFLKWTGLFWPTSCLGVPCFKFNWFLVVPSHVLMTSFEFSGIKGKLSQILQTCFVTNIICNKSK